MRLRSEGPFPAQINPASLSWQQNFPWGLIVPQSEKNRLSQLAVRGPFLEGDLSDESRRQEGGVFLARRIDDGGLFPYERLKFLIERCEVFLVEPRSNLTNVAQIPELIIGAQKQRANVFARAGWLGESYDDELIFLMNLHFQPVH